MNKNTHDEHTIRFLVSKLKPRRYTTTDVAKAVGRSIPTIVRWRRQGLFIPSDHRKFGKLDVYLYTDSDLKAMRKVAEHQRPGRKPAMSQPTSTNSTRRNNANKKGQWAGGPKKRPPSTIAQRRRHR